jgi:pyridinium-3,5-biscarboxylic acid mononucleotide sulfurtransferase
VQHQLNSSASSQDELEKALTVEMAAKFTAIFKPLGFHYVTIDLEGYRQGSLNAVLKGA